MLISVFFGEAVAVAFLAAWLAGRRESRLASDLAGLLAAVAAYLGGHAWAMAGGTPGHVERILMLKYLGVCLIPPFAGFVFARLTGYDRRLTRSVRLGTLGAGLLLALLNATNRYHGWFHSGIRCEPYGNDVIIQLVPAAGYLMHKAWLVSVMAWGAIASAMAWREASALHRRQMALLWLALVIPTGANLLYHAGVRLWGALDYSPLAIAPMMGLLAWSIAREKLSRATPIARSVLIEQLGDGVVVMDGTLRVVDANPAARRVLALEEPYHGRHLRDLLGSRPEILEFCQRHGLKDWEETLEEGDRRWSLVWKPLRSGRGVAPGYMLLIKDVTAQRRREESLQESEAKHRLLLDHATDLVWNLDAAGIFRYVSPAWRRVTGYPPEQIAGTSFRSLVHPDDLPACEAYLLGMVQERQPLASPEYRVRHADGTWHWHAANAMPVLDSLGGFISMVGVSRDISGQKQADEERERLLRERTEAWREATAAALAAGEAEAVRIGHELHDTVCQDLIGLSRLSASIAEESGTADGLRRLTGGLIDMAGRIRDLSYWLAEGDPAADIPLYEALDGHLRQLERLYGVACELSLDDKLSAWPSPGATHVIRVVREAVVNSARHAGARTVWVDGVVQGAKAVISITSDGGTAADPALWRPGLGLRQMRMRAALLGGTLDVFQVGRGAVVELAVPLPDANGDRS